MMRQQPGVRSQPKLLTRNRPEAVVQEPSSRQQLKMPEKMQNIKYTLATTNHHNKENQNQYYVNNLEVGSPKHSQDRKVNKQPTPKADKKWDATYEDRPMTNYHPKRVPAGTSLQNSGYGCLVINTRSKNDSRRNDFISMQQKVRDLENKILKIKETIGKPERKLTVPSPVNTEESQYLKPSVSGNITFLGSLGSLQSNRAEKTERINRKTKEEDVQEKTQANIINNFVTQVPAPSPLIQCSSQSNLFSVSRKPVIGNKYYVSTILQAFLDKSNNSSFAQLCRNHLLTSLQLIKCTKNVEKPKQVKCRPLPKPTKTHTLVFDLDETLIHCNENTEVPHDVLVTIVFPNGQSTKAGINIRPFAVECLKQLSEYFEIIVFTASHECYGQVVVNYLDPNRQYISHCYFRDSCHKSQEGFFIKDLRVVDRQLDKMLLIDNAAYSYAFQSQNGVPVIPFYDCKADLELKNLTSYLKGMAGVKDIRKEHCSQLKTNEYHQFSDALDLITKLYAEYLNK